MGSWPQSFWPSNVVCETDVPHVFELTNRVRTSFTPVGKKVGSRMSATRSPSHDDLRARACHNGFQLLLLGLRNPELIQRVLQVVQEGLPFGRGNPELLV